MRKKIERIALGVGLVTVVTLWTAIPLFTLLKVHVQFILVIVVYFCTPIVAKASIARIREMHASYSNQERLTFNKYAAVTAYLLVGGGLIEVIILLVALQLYDGLLSLFAMGSIVLAVGLSILLFLYCLTAAKRNSRKAKNKMRIS